ncbi:MAG: rod shape-determining protein MreC [Clostridia bacterium]|nr:rod shape-determining protein MreC [Clostridia bacterium]
MRFFLRSRQFKIIIAIFCAVVLLTVSFAVLAKRMSPQTDIAGTISAPFRNLFTNISNVVADFVDNYNSGSKLSLENTELRAEIDTLRQQIANMQEITEQNAFYKEYLGIKESNPDFIFADATIIARDNNDPYGSFTVNRGSASDITKYDPVITDAGIVGYVTEVGLTSCKVTTILSPDIKLGALDNRTSDSGIVTGSLSFAENGFCQFANLARSCNVAVGDYVITSGEGIFPEGLLIGSVNNIGIDENNNSIYAEIKPFAEISELRSVMIITSFEGQGSINIGGEK